MRREFASAQGAERLEHLIADIREQTYALAQRNALAFERAMRKREHFDISSRAVVRSVKVQQQSEAIFESSRQKIERSRSLLRSVQSAKPNGSEESR